MSGSKFILAAITAFALAGCAQNSWDDTGFGSGTGTGAGVNAGVSDPTSPAYFRETIGDRVLFSVNEHDISTEAQAVLQGQARWLTANPDYTVTIEGHADEQGTREYNLALGARRANSAREYLISQGVAGSRIKVLTYGKERPIEICSNESCYAQNRRAVTVLATDLLG